MNTVIVGDEWTELNNLETIDKLANVWYYSKEDAVAIYICMLLISNGSLYIVRRYGQTEPFENFLKVSQMTDKYNEFLGYAQKSANLNSLNIVCSQNFITLEIEEWDGDDPLYQMYYPESPLYCLEPSDDSNWVNDTIDNIPLPKYDE